MQLVQKTESKKCNKCGEHRPIDQYRKNKKCRGGIEGTCHTCHSERVRDHHLRKNYGITIEEYNQMFDLQQGQCACCGIHQIELTNALAVDHNHDTMAIRGLLCSNRNSGIGQLGDNIEGVRKALKYLEDAE